MRVFLFLCSIFEVFALLYRQRIRVSAHSFTAPLSLLRAASLHYTPSTTRHAGNAHFEADIALYNALIRCRDPELGVQINKSLSIIGDALRLYGPESVVASYNGGKDADVVMSLMRAATAKFSLDHNLSSSSAVFIYFEVESEFPEVVEHIKNQEKLLGLRLVRSPKGIVQGISEYMENSKSGPLAFVLGTRKGDPNCGDQQFFSPSSSWMPPFMRVNPILNWTYGQVWDLLRTFELKFCELYNEVL
jgi:FAD synthetase